MSAQLPTAETTPTTARAGAEIEPTRVECPFCQSSGVTERTVCRCGCGRWFEVVDAKEVDGDE